MEGVPGSQGTGLGSQFITGAERTLILAGGTDGVGAVATKPGAAIVWAVGESGAPGSFNPLVLRNG